MVLMKMNYGGIRMKDEIYYMTDNGKIVDLEESKKIEKENMRIFESGNFEDYHKIQFLYKVGIFENERK